MTNPDLANSYNNFWGIYHDQGDYAKALDYLLKSHSILTKILPPNHSQMAWSCSSIATSYKNMEQYELALKWKCQALYIAQHAFPDGHPDRKNYHDLVAYLEYKN